METDSIGSQKNLIPKKLPHTAVLESSKVKVHAISGGYETRFQN